MTSIAPFAIDFTGMPWYLALLLVAAGIAAAIWYYTGAVPAVTGWKKRAFIVLRAATLILVVLALVRPILTIRSMDEVVSRTAVLLDLSSSMNRPDNPSRQADALTAFEALHEYLGNRADYYGFSNSFHLLDSSRPAFDGAGTDVATALVHAAGLPDVTDIVLISDGRWNLGTDPDALDTGDIAVHSLLAGSSAETVPDAVISGISAPSVGKAGDTASVEITVGVSASVPDPVPVSILDGDRIIASTTVDLSEGSAKLVKLDVPLDTPGTHTYAAVIMSPSDRIEENNRREFGIRVMRSSFRILIAAPRPSPDYAFLLRALTTEETISVKTAIGGLPEAMGGAFPPDLSPYDALILFDGGGISPEEGQRIRSRVNDGGGLWIAGSTPPGHELGLDPVLPIAFPDPAEIATVPHTVERTEAGLVHVITASGETSRIWNNLPPVAPLAGNSSRENTAVLAVAHADTGTATVPAVITGNYGAGKVLAMPFSGFWRWKLKLAGTGEDTGFFDSMATAAVNWLTTETSTSPLMLATDRAIYLSGEKVTVTARLYDSVYAPVTGAMVTVTVDDDPSAKRMLGETSPAVYTGSIRGLAPGAHVIHATASRDGVTTEAATPVTIQALSLELLNPNPDPMFMQRFASTGSGTFRTAAEVEDLLPLLAPRYRRERRERIYSLALHPLVLILILVVLTIEWAVRKKRGML